MKRTAQIVLALALPVALVALTVAAAHARWEASSGLAARPGLATGGDAKAPNSEVILLYALAALGIICHALVIIGGRHENDALAYLHFALHARGIKARETDSKRRYNESLHRFQALLPQYADFLGEHNRQYPEAPLAAGPFVNATYKLAERVFPGYLARPLPQEGAPDGGQNGAPAVEPPETPLPAAPVGTASADPTPEPQVESPQANVGGTRATEIKP